MNSLGTYIQSVGPLLGYLWSLLSNLGKLLIDDPQEQDLSSHMTVQGKVHLLCAVVQSTQVSGVGNKQYYCMCFHNGTQCKCLEKDVTRQTLLSTSHLRVMQFPALNSRQTLYKLLRLVHVRPGLGPHTGTVC